jgi:hypothetical protein
MHVAVIGHRDSWLTERCRASYYLFELISPIKEAILSVEMEMTKLRHYGLARKVNNMT